MQHPASYLPKRIIIIPTICVLATIACQPTPTVDPSVVPGVFVPAETYQKLENALQNPTRSGEIEKSNAPTQEANNNEQTLALNLNSNTNQLSNGDSRVNYNQYPVYTNEQQDLGNQQQVLLANQQISPLNNQQIPTSSQQTNMQNQPSLQFLNQKPSMPNQPQLIRLNYIPNQQSLLLSQELKQPVNQQLQQSQPIFLQPINQQPDQSALVQPRIQSLQSNLPALIQQPMNQQILPNQPTMIQPINQQLQPVNQQILPNQAILIPQSTNQQTLLVPQNQPLLIGNGQIVSQYNPLGSVPPNGGTSNQLYTIVPLNVQNIPNTNLANSNAFLIPVQSLNN